MERRLVAIAEIILCSSVPTQLLITGLLRAAGWRPVDARGQLSFSFVVALSVADTFVLIALMVALTRAHGESVAGLWLGNRRIGREAILGALLIPVVFFMVVVLLNAMRVLAPWLHNVALNPLEDLARTPGEAAVFGLVAILAGGGLGGRE